MGKEGRMGEGRKEERKGGRMGEGKDGKKEGWTRWNDEERKNGRRK